MAAASPVASRGAIRYQLSGSSLVCVQEAPDQLFHGPQILCRHGIGDHHVALLREARQIGVAEHTGAHLPFAGYRLVRQLGDLGGVHCVLYRTSNRAMRSSTQA